MNQFECSFIQLYLEIKKINKMTITNNKCHELVMACFEKGSKNWAKFEATWARSMNYIGCLGLG